MGEPDQRNHPRSTRPSPYRNRDVLTELAPREFEVLEHLVAGRRNKAISERLGVSESTVKFHVAGGPAEIGRRESGCGGRRGRGGRREACTLVLSARSVSQFDQGCGAPASG